VGEARGRARRPRGGGRAWGEGSRRVSAGRAITGLWA
jgi:hypothetical protein